MVWEGEQFATPQQAIDAVSDGDTIFIKAGTYEFNDSIELWGHNDIWILGEEDSRLICAVLHYGHNLMMETNHLEGLTMEDNTILNNGGRRMDMLYCAGSSTAGFNWLTCVES